MAWPRLFDPTAVSREKRLGDGCITQQNYREQSDGKKKSKKQRQNAISVASPQMMAASADPPEHLAEILREILALTGSGSASCPLDDAAKADKRPSEKDKLDSNSGKNL
jgi:hypothetical protein